MNVDNPIKHPLRGSLMNSDKEGEISSVKAQANISLPRLEYRISKTEI